MSMDRILRSSSQRPADGKPDPRQALVPRLPRTGQRRQGARQENDMGLQGGINKERPFRGRQGRRVVESRRGRHREEEKKRKANKKRQKDMDKLQPFGFFVPYEWIKELILQRCLLILMFNGLRIKAGGSAKK